MKAPYRVVCRFYPNQANPQRASGRGVWRVRECWGPGVIVITRPVALDQRLYLASASPFKKGSRVDPAKIALAAVRA